jgi:hypothetical protein
VKRKHLLFLLGLIVFTISAFRLLREYDSASLVGFVGSLTVIIGEYFSSKKIPTIENLKKMAKPKVVELAEENGLNISYKLTKDDLSLEIINGLKNQKRKWEKFKIKLFGVSVLVILLLTFTFPLPKHTYPMYSMAFYESTSKGLKIIDRDSLKVAVSAEDILHNEMKIPLQIALRNDESAPLKVVKVVVTYPKSIDVISKGSHQISPNSNSIIYEHDLQTLEATRNFIPLKTIDTLIVPFKFFVTNLITLTKDDIPIYSVIIYDSTLFKEKRIDFDIDIFCEDRQTVHGKISPKIKAGLKLIMDLPNGKIIDPSKEDEKLFCQGIPNSKTASEWESIVKSTNQKMRYVKKVNKNHVLRYVYLDNILRRLTVSDTAGIINYVLLNTSNSNHPNRKINGDNETVTFDWEKSDLN